jgi:hypothetical protein
VPSTSDGEDLFDERGTRAAIHHEDGSARSPRQARGEELA